MERKIIFFDVDGTLVDVRPAREYIPESTIQAVHAAREKGNLCFLCTGRSKAEIYSHRSLAVTSVRLMMLQLVQHNFV